MYLSLFIHIAVYFCLLHFWKEENYLSVSLSICTKSYFYHFLYWKEKKLSLSICISLLTMVWRGGKMSICLFIYLCVPLSIWKGGKLYINLFIYQLYISIFTFYSMENIYQSVYLFVLSLFLLHLLLKEGKLYLSIYCSIKGRTTIYHCIYLYVFITVLTRKTVNQPIYLSICLSIAVSKGKTIYYTIKEQNYLSVSISICLSLLQYWLKDNYLSVILYLFIY